VTGTAGRRGMLVAVEGIDGSGKSTFVRALGTALRRRGWTVARRREPADATLGRRAQAASVRDPWTGGVYFTVDRHLAQGALARSLATHNVVLTDRSFYSTLAYQGSALPRRARRRLEELQRRATIVPDRVVLLELGADEAIRRLESRGLHRDPLERRKVLRRVGTAYRALARRRGWIVVDARLSTEVEVRTILLRLERVLPPPQRRSSTRVARRRR
jgi:dTMP kinase